MTRNKTATAMPDDDLRRIGHAALFGGEVGKLGTIKVKATDTTQQGQIK